MNRLLKRQLRKYYGDVDKIPNELNELLNAINDTYNHHDQDRVLIERSLEISSEELNAANTQMRAIFKLFPDIYFRINNKGQILDLSTGNSENLLSFNQDFVGKFIYNIPQEDVGNSFKQAITNTLKSQKRESFEYSLEIENVKKHFEASLIPIFENQIIVFVKDITERKTFEEELQKAKEKAEESDKLKSAFLANMSHEIRTPMNSIIGFTEMLNDEDFSKEEKDEFVGIIQSSGYHLLALINDIIDLSKIEAGQLSLQTKECDINKLIFETNMLFSGKKKIKEGKIKLYARSSLPDSESIILTDPLRLKQVLINLLSNSLKFTTDGEIHFGYSLTENNGRKMVKFFVKDTGIGISKEDIDLVFERFSQAKNNHLTNNDGTGLGLSISKKLINLLGGDIWLKSEIDKGSEFYFTLPYKQTKDFQQVENISKETKPNNYNLKGTTVLIVEDQPNNYLFLNTFFKIKKINVLNAKNGAEAVELCEKNNSIDVVLMDLKMPIMDGFEATRIIKSFKPNLPIIAQTAFAMNQDSIRAFEAGCDDYITKPIKSDLLLKTIAKHINHQ